MNKISIKEKKLSNLQSIDAKVLAAINQEKQRQLDNLELYCIREYCVT